MQSLRCRRATPGHGGKAAPSAWSSSQRRGMGAVSPNQTYLSLFLFLPFLPCPLFSHSFLLLTFSRPTEALASSPLNSNGAFRANRIFPFDLSFHPEDLPPIDTTPFFKARTGLVRLWGSMTMSQIPGAVMQS